ncbi:sensor histidine kinase [Paenibacillus contaminans]|nr:sensor histidine kinase [Paenibacillus contaminans]
MRLWKKIILIYLIVILIPILVLDYFLSKSIGAISFRSSLELSKVSLDQLGENITNKLGVYYDVIDGLSNDLQFNSYMNTVYTTDYDALHDYRAYIQPLFERLNYKISDVVIRVYTQNASIGFSGILNNSMEDLKREGWADLSNPTGGVIRWAGAGNSIKLSNKEYLGGYRFLLNSRKDYNLDSVLAVFFRKDELYSLISKENEGGKKIFFYNEEGNILVSTESESEYRNIQDVKFDNPSSEKSKGYFLAKYKGSDYIVLNKKIDQSAYNINNWSITYMIPTGTIYASIHSIRVTSIVLSLLCIVFSLILTHYLSRNITGRIKKILVKIGKVKRGNYTISDEISGTDEIGILNTSFNEMVDKINTLIHEVYEAEIRVVNEKLKSSVIETRVKEAKIITLQSQINPHYLFNTLESIRMRLLIKGDRETSDIIGMFGETFRLSLSSNHEWYKLADEIRFVDSFFLIQKYRYGDRVNYEKHVPAELLNFYIPKLILQPLIENSIYHGIEMKSAGGMVTVRAFIEEGELVLTVADNGAGMEEDELQAVREDIRNSAESVASLGHTRIALKNIHTRLKLMFGDQYGLTINSRKGFGTEVRVTLPVLDDSGEGGMKRV